ncbi:MAG: hypothetical protein E7409_06375 [Ruminococcaceae bacterium]|nr:hypothetical protein [Oscillospiraceae bacterium]
MSEKEQDIKLKKGVFGYSSKNVDGYLLEITANYDEQLRKRDERIAELTARVGELTEKLNAYEKERLDVANTLVAAQQKAQAMVDNAAKDAEAKKAALSAEVAQFENRRNQAKEAMEAFRKESIELMTKYRELVDTATRINPAKKDA